MTKTAYALALHGGAAGEAERQDREGGTASFDSGDIEGVGHRRGGQEGRGNRRGGEGGREGND